MREEQKKLSDFTLFGKQKEDNAQLKEKQLKQLTPYKVIPIRLKGTNKTEKIDHSNKEHGRMQVTKGNCLLFRGSSEEIQKRVWKTSINATQRTAVTQRFGSM
ncbi:MAG: hypothetical protein ACTSPO_14345 [Candidatus Heimdallarchaeaceae archaeon]